MPGTHRLPRARAHRGRSAALAGLAAVVGTLVVVMGGRVLAQDHGTAHPGADDVGTGRVQASSALPGDGGVDPVPARGPGRAVRLVMPQTLPSHSGHGRRVVFDISDQRVWLVRADGSVRSTYLASGSLTDNLRPGHYTVFSRSRWAVGIDDSGSMQYFVRFAHGRNAAIGFHSIPTKDGRPLQSRAQLGQPESHGCIRQALPDAIRLWHFAPVGTPVVVTR